MIVAMRSPSATFDIPRANALAYSGARSHARASAGWPRCTTVLVTVASVGYRSHGVTRKL
jgi:hypothetical protein